VTWPSTDRPGLGEEGPTVRRTTLVGGATIVNRFERMEDAPAQTDVSKAMSKDLKKRGFVFVGPTTCYAMMQACGLVNDHLVTCPRWRELDQVM